MNENQKRIVANSRGGIKSVLPEKRAYEPCRVEIVSFDTKDILRTSGELEDKDNLGGWKDEWNNKKFKGCD